MATDPDRPTPPLSDDDLLLVEPSPENLQRVLNALSELPDHAARELTVQDLQDNVVVKIADAVMVDVAKQAWTLDYQKQPRTPTHWSPQV
jgi:hypothetical protein